MTKQHLRTVVTAALAAVGLAIAAGCSTPAAGPAGTAGAGQQAGSTQQAGGVRQLAAQVTDQATGTGAGTGTTDGQRVITVTGVGTVSGTPDTLTVQLGVDTKANSASKALQANNSKAAALISTLKSHGVAAKDLQTSDLSIDPTYSNNGSKVTGYEVTNTVTATLHAVDKAGTLIDAAQQAVGNAIQLDQVGFSFSDDSALRAAARTDAVKQAMAQAKQLADAAGVTLGPVQSITESASSSSQIQPIYSAATSAAAGTPVLAGQQNLTVQVKMVVAIG